MTDTAATQQEPSDKIFTVANVITFIRLAMIPAFFVCLLLGHSIAAAILFGAAAATDFLDGQIARRTNTVTKLGQMLDPAVDRLLMVFGVIGLLVVGRLPLWIILVVLIRDLLMLMVGSYLLVRYKKRVHVIYAGKVATTLLFFGFAFLILNLPQVAGLGLCDFGWLPGFNAQMCSIGIWFVYAGLCLAIVTTALYARQAYGLWREAKKEQRERSAVR